MTNGRSTSIARTLMDSARLYARAGEFEAAMESLEEVIASGYTDTEWWHLDADLSQLAGDPRFERLVHAGEERVVGVSR